MRVFLIVMLLVLTPLRAWSADSMAVHMAMQSTADPANDQARQVASSELDSHCAGMSDTLAHTTPGANEESIEDSGDPCGNCSACQVCATVVCLTPIRTSEVTSQGHHLPRFVAPAFSQADVAPDQKPPIF